MRARSVRTPVAAGGAAVVTIAATDAAPAAAGAGGVPAGPAARATAEPLPVDSSEGSTGRAAPDRAAAAASLPRAAGVALATRLRSGPVCPSVVTGFAGCLAPGGVACGADGDPDAGAALGGPAEVGGEAAADAAAVAMGAACVGSDELGCAPPSAATAVGCASRAEACDGDGGCAGAATAGEEAGAGAATNRCKLAAATACALVNHVSRSWRMLPNDWALQMRAVHRTCARNGWTTEKAATLARCTRISGSSNCSRLREWALSLTLRTPRG